MDWKSVLPKVGAVALIAFTEIKEDLKDNKITVNEIIGATKAVVDKLGYGDIALINFTKDK